MRWCPQCGTQAQPDARFCHNCGRAFVTAPELLVAPPERFLPNIIPLQRLLLMTVFSAGIYLFYWSYVTWKQYRDHATALGLPGKHYPVWHALAIGSVPIYGLFRIHAHFSAYRDLRIKAGLPPSVSPSVGVAMFILAGVLLIRVNRVSIGLELLLVALSAAVIAILLYRLQKDINAYWRALAQTTTGNVPTSPWEVALSIVGVLWWALMALQLLFPSLRP